MTRLRRVSPAAPGWTRRRSGRGFRYLDEAGRPLPAEDVERVKALVIPPAWREVWICPHPRGHLQATGVDAAGRRQYLYHPVWRQRRDELKFQRVATAARRLPTARRRIAADLVLPDLPLQRAAATAVRLLDLGAFRIGNDYYADANGSFGLSTLERHHLSRSGDQLTFSFPGKSGIEHTVTIEDPLSVAAIEAMRTRRGSARLFSYRGPAGWADLGSAHVNSYLAELFGGDFTAKDFRTWHATVLAARSLAITGPAPTPTARKRAVRAAVVEVAGYLGNTPTIARASYVDPRVIDRYEGGTTIRDTLGRTGPERASQTALERAVLALLSEAE